jgi:hypothetical protein
MALVTAADLKTYMDISLTNRQLDAADMVLEGLQSELEMYLRRPLEVLPFTEVYVIPSSDSGIPASSFFTNDNPSGDSFYDSQVQSSTLLEPNQTVYLKNTPVVTVTSVTHKPFRGTVRTLVVDQDYIVRGYGVEVFVAYANDTVTVTYTGGVDGPSIAAFKLIILRAASREMQNMHDDVVGLKDLETRNVAPLQTGFLESELLTLKRYRKNRIS